MVLPVLSRLASRTWQRRVLLFAAAFATLNLVTYPVGRALGEPLFHYNWIAQDKIAQMERLAEAGACVEVLVQGNSLAAGGVDPARLAAATGGRGYNAALWGTQLHHDVQWLGDFVLPRLDPKVVVLVVSPLSVSTTSAIAEEVEGKWQAAPATQDGFTGKLDRLAARFLPVVRYRDLLADPSKWRDLLGGEPDPEDVRDPLLAQMDDLGYIPDDRELDLGSKQSTDLANFAEKFWVGDWTLSKSELDAMSDIARAVHAEGASLLVALAPTSATYRSLLPEGETDFEHYRTAVREAASMSADMVVDLSDLPIPPSWFYDHIHLNRKGAQMFTDALTDPVARLASPCDFRR